MKINKTIAFAIGILFVAGMGFVTAYQAPQGNPFVIKNLTTQKTVAWIDRDGNANFTGKVDFNLQSFTGTGNLGGGNLSANSVTGTQIDESTLVGVPTYNATVDAYITANVSNIAATAKDLTCTNCIGTTEISGLTQDDLASTFSLLWGNITGYNLNSIWTGNLGFGNLTNYNLNVVWSNKLGYNNITACADTQILKVSGSTWACAADATGTAVDSYVNTTGDTITGNITVSSGTGLNATTGAAITYDGIGGFIVTLV